MHTQTVGIQCLGGSTKVIGTREASSLDISDTFNDDFIS